jgi:protein-tyrosine phosphatase
VCLERDANKAHLATVLIDIADYAAPTPAQFVAGMAAILRAMRAAPAAEIYVGCRAGIGRTGTVLAGLAKVAGIAAPVAFVRAHYHPEAVETRAQADAVAALDVEAVLAAV